MKMSCPSSYAGTKICWPMSLLLLLCFIKTDCFASKEEYNSTLPAGVSAVWDIAKAYQETTPTRERICINGLWQWQPAVNTNDVPPSKQWGYFKVPGSWPGITDYMQKDCQRIYAHPDWKDIKYGSISQAWYQRDITIPTNWMGRSITLELESLNSYAIAFVDGKKAGEMRFPGGSLDLSGFVQPGNRHTLSLCITALPLKGVMLSYTDTASAREVKGSVARRGLCGDVYLTSIPKGPRIEGARIFTSVRKWEIAFESVLHGLEPDKTYALKVEVLNKGQRKMEFTSGAFSVSNLEQGRLAFTNHWKPERLWDIHTPSNQYDCRTSLVDSQGNVIDTFWTGRFGFREFWIDGRDFYLNGTRLFLSSVPLDNAQVGAAWATYEAACESMKRLKTFGINFVYTHNYDCLPGSHLAFAEILKAADDSGMLVALSQPHFSHYDWKMPDADQNNGYATHAAFYTRMAQNHPSVVFIQ